MKQFSIEPTIDEYDFMTVSEYVTQRKKVINKTVLTEQDNLIDIDTFQLMIEQETIKRFK